MKLSLEKAANLLTSVSAGIAAFLFTLVSFLMLRNLGEQVMASFTIGLFAVALTWIAYERPNSGQNRAVAALIERLLAVPAGDLSSPAPAALREEMPALAAAVDGLFEQVRSTLDDANAIALYDPVTSLPNRIHFTREAERMLDARRGDQLHALLFLDLDRFKEVNDTAGHARGDEVLAMVAERLRGVVLAEGRFGTLGQPILARYAGDEFVLLLPGIADPGEAEHVAHRALASLVPPVPDGGSLGVGASIGIALAPRDGSDLPALLHAADCAMYRAKANGRSQVCSAPTGSGDQPTTVLKMRA
jgi:diguanylate cyclase (GGDEF)-like protein